MSKIGIDARINKCSKEIESMKDKSSVWETRLHDLIEINKAFSESCKGLKLKNEQAFSEHVADLERKVRDVAAILDDIKKELSIKEVELQVLLETKQRSKTVLDEIAVAKKEKERAHREVRLANKYLNDVEDRIFKLNMDAISMGVLPPA